MQHLDATRLAAFDHEPFTTDELAHLAACATCRAERDATVQLIARAAQEAYRSESPDALRLIGWEQLAPTLRQEGLLISGEHALPGRAMSDASLPEASARGVRGRPSWSRRLLLPMRQAAAALALLAGGITVGRLSNAPSAGNASIAEAGVAGRTVGFGEPGYVSVEQATDVLNRAQRDYERASLWLASHDSTVQSSEVFRARLAALDQMMAASRAALREAPQDPLLNHYYLAAYTAREATLQQLGGTLPVDKVIERY
jgi:hypothetical protein